jgi:predicted metal-dependent HD superfamily phosphohydrolase
VDAVKQFCLNAYNEPHRKYHNLHHIERGFNHLYDFVTSGADFHSIDLNVVSYSWLMHDICYEVGDKNNEQYSAELAYDFLSFMDCEQIDKCKVFDCIIDTKHRSNKPYSTESALVRDFDLADLGTSQFWINNRNIGMEFLPNYTMNEIREGSIKLFQGFLNREKIFFTNFFYNKYEQTARQNLETYIKG